MPPPACWPPSPTPPAPHDDLTRPHAPRRRPARPGHRRTPGPQIRHLLLPRHAHPPARSPRRHVRHLCLLPPGGRHRRRTRPLNLKAKLLDDWRARIEALFHSAPPTGTTDDDATARVLLLATNRYALRRADFLAIIDGMQMDAETIIVAPAFDTLDLYCDRVASAVGRLSVRAFGDASAAADEVAHHLGRALQLTNILRDLGEDAWRGRLYLPREWLALDGVPTEAAAALASPDLPKVCEHAVREARHHFNMARSAMQRCNRRAMKPARLMAATYSALLDRMEARGWGKPEQRVSVPKWEKLVIALRYGLG